MYRHNAMKAFAVSIDEGSLAAAGRELGRSPAAVRRTIAFQEPAGIKLPYRTTRSIKLSEDGLRYVASCRRALAELDEADICVSEERSCRATPFR